MGTNHINISATDNNIHYCDDIRKKDSGWFWISKRAVECLLKNSATAKHICIFLLLAGYADRTGTFTSVSYKAFRKHLSIGKEEADNIVADLRQFEIGGQNLVYKYSEWFKSPANFKKHDSYDVVTDNIYIISPKWALNTFSNDAYEGIWFSRELIEGNNLHPRTPIKTLLSKGFGDDCTRLLLYLFSQNNLADHWGLDPNTTFYIPYEMEKLSTEHGYDFWSGTEKELEIRSELIDNLLKYGILHADHKLHPLKQLEKLFNCLQEYNFLYRIVCAIPQSQNQRKSYQERYLLDVKDKISMHKHDNYFKMATKIQNIASIFGHLAGVKGKSNSWRFYKKYIAIVQESFEVQIISIFRLSFDITHGKSAAANIYRKDLVNYTRITSRLISKLKTSTIFD